MEKIILFIFLLSSIFKLSAQISFYIQEIKVSNIYIQDNKDFITIKTNEGPYLDIMFTIKNNSDSTIQLKPNTSNMWLHFKYNNRNYQTNVISFAFMDKDLLELLPDEEYHDFIFSSIFLGSQFLKNKILKEKGDYVFELMEVLPTLKLYYKEEDLTISSSEIKNVKVVYNCKE